MQRIPHYGIDAPPVVRNLTLMGAAMGAAPLFHGPIWWLVIPAGLFLLTAGAMVRSSRVGKLRQRELLLDRVKWSGNERVLDLGCGRGLLAVGAANRLTTGLAVGIDIWQAQDLSGNGPQAVLASAEAEGAGGRVAVLTADMRRLPFADESFDVVISSLAMHNIPEDAGRRAALADVVRVLKPGGWVLLQDIQYTADYERIFNEMGMQAVDRSGLQYRILPWPRIVSARKPK